MLRKLKIHNFEEIGAAWASHVSELREVGITSLELNPFKNFSAVYWLDQFPFLEELSLRTDNLPEESTLLKMTGLKNLGLGQELKGRVKSLRAYENLLPQLDFLALFGKCSE